ncbi:class F sortase [Streptomyces shenzhenensis]|uniref:class F sortase n=1 Tax=Streptomyces shenzhenensis TaxID=943815 RepID=UPI0015F03DAA|nr:class F sortase [Streptomyces shenzhenensis]
MAAGPTPTPDGPDGRNGPGSPRRGGMLPVWGIAFLLLAVALIAGRPGGSDTTGTSPPVGTDAAPSADPRRSGAALPRSAPTRLRIPKIAVDAPFTVLTMGSTGELDPPPADNTNLVGWYSGGAAPGEEGTAIIAGHVDTTTSAAVFARLDRLERGDRFTVSRADDTDATFVVDDADTFAKDDFPSDRVYADTRRPEVRLITCAGDYDHDAKDYTENLVVFAHLV